MIKKHMGKIALILLLCFLLTACEEPVSVGDKYYEAAVNDFKEGNFQNAISNCQLALDNDVKTVTANYIYNLQGNAYLNLNKYVKALECFEKALELNEDDYQAWTNKGIAYRQQDDYDKAEVCYEKAISINPDYAEAHVSLGSLCILTRKSEKAIEHLETAILLEPAMTVAYGNVALAYATVGRFEDAESALSKAEALGYENTDDIRAEIDKFR